MLVVGGQVKKNEFSPHRFYLHKEFGSAVNFMLERSNVVMFFSDPNDREKLVTSVLANKSVFRFFNSLMESGNFLRLGLSDASKPD